VLPKVTALGEAWLAGSRQRNQKIASRVPR
jgi:hypothetical protein